MPKVLLTWELGGGLGHLMNLLPLARGLSKAGHQVSVALRDLSRAGMVFSGIPLAYFQAPVKTRAATNRINPPRTFPHILHNIGFRNFDELRVMTEAWRNLYEHVQPDLIIFDHSPTALLAARGSRAKRALVGNGFVCPPDQYPLPDLRPWLPGDSERQRREEDQVLDNVNRILDTWGEPPLERLARLYHQVDESFLVTFKELDPYRSRNTCEYWGAFPNLGGKGPVWPQGPGRRVYAYVKPFRALPKLLAVLNELRCPTLVYLDSVDPRLQTRFQSATLRFENEPLDLAQVSEHCDLAILNGTHSTTASMLLAGVPTLQVPIFLEQALTSDAVVRIGAGLSAPATAPYRIAEQLISLANSEDYAEGAFRFADRYADFVPEQRIAKMVRRAQELLN